MKCDLCSDKKCYHGHDCIKLAEAGSAQYQGEDKKIHQAAALIEAKYYMQKTRIEELILFCRELGYNRLGVAFCIGLQDEAKVVCSYLRRHFKVYSACCKVCGIPKDEMGLPKIDDGRFEAMCNPLTQARALKDSSTELNITVGLCIGHDILFNRHSHVPATTLIVKDRVLSHNPAGAIYTGYYKNKLGGKED